MIGLDMALPLEALRVVQIALQGLDPRVCESQRVLSLGYPDILAAPDELAALFGAQLVPAFQYREDSAEIARWHGLPETVPIVEAQNFFALLGYDLEVLDVVKVRGGEMVHDLNQPLPAELQGRYALVIDPGTLEHCFNIAQAAKNVAELVAMGGCAFHANPLNMFNHGFYNLNPTWYHDFYRASGFSLQLVEGVANAVRQPTRFHVPPARRFGDVPPESSLYVLARRVADTPVRWPTQSKYVNNPNLKA
jgi:hypothetical protein